MKKSKGIIILLLILAILCGLGYYAADVAKATNTKEDGITLGLDLSGGVSITYEIADEKFSQTDVDDTIATLEERIEEVAMTTEYAVYQVGDDRITVEIPGVFDANKVLEELGTPGALYFIMEYDDAGNKNFEYDSSLADTEDVPYKLNYTIDELIANGSIVLTGEDVQSAKAAYQQTNTVEGNSPVVELVFNDDAADVFYDATSLAAEKNCRLAIYYDGHFRSVPSVSKGISGGKCVVEGMSSFEDAQELAGKISSGAIELELTELESNVVGAQFGGEALTTSVKAALIGLVLVMLFMIVMYRVSGLAASIALAIYTFAVVAFINLFEVTLTLPGIAGIILGIGMAVDANVITFARIREEIAAGRTVWAAINEGYKKALSAILDGNITTFIAGIILMALGTGTVRGFAYTLMISIGLSMVTAIFIAKWIMKALYALGFKSEKFYGKAKTVKVIDFMKHRFVYFIISAVVIIAGFVGMGVYGSSTGKALNYGIEFAGGTSTTADFGKEYSIADIEKEIVPVVSEVTGDSNIQATTVDGTTQIVLKTRSLSLAEREELGQALAENFGVDESTIDNQTISSTISGEMRSKALIAVAFSCAFMLIYIWFRFKDLRFGASAIIALVHDVLVVLAAYALLRVSVGNTFIACMLTIVGYSINDTIVVFDRIRENMHGIEFQTKAELTEVANKSLSQTLSRTINTSITTIIMVVLLFIFGVPSIREFALPLMVGMICGSYSSIFIATELWYIFKLRFSKEKLQ